MCLANTTMLTIQGCVCVQCNRKSLLNHWGRLTHICVSKLTIIGSDNGLSPGRRQAIIWTNAVIFLIRTLGTNFSAILSKIHAFSFKKMHLKMSSAKWRPFCLGPNMMMLCCLETYQGSPASHLRIGDHNVDKAGQYPHTMPSIPCVCKYLICPLQ